MNVQEKLILTVINYVRKYIERKLDFQERWRMERKTKKKGRKLHYFQFAVTKKIKVKDNNERM